ncbi:MAG: hypothetical protein FWE32_01735 [Oscillospiraceae bacterium]|nr:hypothetical protein [Oscillospiraceae bacterium]
MVDLTNSLSEDHIDRMLYVSQDLQARTGFELWVMTAFRKDSLAIFVEGQGILLLYTVEPLAGTLYLGEDLRLWFDDETIAEFEADVLASIHAAGPSPGMMNGYGALARYLYQIAGVEKGGEIEALLTIHTAGEGGGGPGPIAPIIIFMMVAVIGWSLLVASRNRKRLKEWKVKSYAGHVSTRRDEDKPSQNDHHSYPPFHADAELEVYPEEQDVFVDDKEEKKK